MRRFIVLLSLVLSVLFVITESGTATNYHGRLQVFEHQYQQDGQTYTEIEVRTGLTDYIFSTRDGSIRSVFLYFAPYGLRPAELIADTTTTVTAPGQFTREYAADGIYPFALVDATGTSIGPYSYRILDQTRQSTRIRFTATTSAGLRIEKTFTIRDDPFYTVELELKISGGINTPGASQDNNGNDLEMLLGTDRFPVASGQFVQGKIYYLIDGQRLEAIPEKYKKFTGLGTVSRQLVLFLKDLAGKSAPAVGLDKHGRPRLGVRLGLQPQAAENSYRFLLYAGRAKYTLLQHSGLGQLLTLSVWSRSLVGVVRLLDWLYALTGNYGWVIILFTLMVRVLLFPLMRKQYYSIAKMQRLQPKIQQLQKRYKQDKEILQRKMMELYQKEGINPFSGCLPMLIQLPILWLLWRAILYSAEQIHLSPGFLWMSDLSVADPYYIIVVLNVVAMIFQTLLSTPATTSAEGKPKQNWALILGMPLFMGYLLRNFPAGMCLYWLLTTLFQIGQQWLINAELRKLGPVVIEPEPEPEPATDTGDERARSGDEG